MAINNTLLTVEDIYIDFSTKKYERISVTQYDKNGHVFKVHCMQKSVIRPVNAETENVRVKMMKPDGNPVINDCEVNEDGTVLLVMDEQMCAASGDAKLQLMLSNTETGDVVHTKTIIVNIDESTVDNKTVSSSYEFDALNSALIKAHEGYNTVIRYSDMAKESEENAKASETASKTSELNAKASETAFKTSELNAKASETASKTSELNAKASETASKTSETNAKTSELNAKASETSSKTSETNALAYKDAAFTSASSANTSATNAKESEENAKASETASKTSELNAHTSELNAKASETSSKTSENNASYSAISASESEENASTYANNSSASASISKSYAVGETGTRENENIDNAKYYAEQAERIAEGLEGSLIPMGTISFSDLQNTSIAGYMYNINGEFTTTDRFKEGAGNVIPAGTNVYYTADGFWDCMAGSPVTGIKGNAESSYRRGNVNITPENIGLGNVQNDVQELELEIADMKAFVGYTDDDICGITVDLANKTFTRLAGAKGLSGGEDFNKFKMYGNRRRCNVADDGTINCYYGEAGYTEDGSNGQVMVYQPKFYYKVVPLLVEQNTQGIGYHLRKANYYVSDYPLAGFKLHPAFYDAQGNEIDYILMGAYEGSIFDVSENAYIFDDAQVMDYANDLFCSIAGAKLASGKTQNLTRPNVNQMCMNRGAGWYLDNIKATSANQMLMIVEMGMMNMQTAIGQGVVSVRDNPNTENNSKVTGGTSALGNGTGQATGTSGHVSVSYRGYENPWGNIWKFIYGVNIWGDGTLGGGVPYYATDFNFEESKRTNNYVSAGFSVSNADGLVSAIGYAPECDWMFIASECLGNSSVPVGDYTYITANLNGYRIARLGGGWSNGAGAGAFCWTLNAGVGASGCGVGGRLVYVPTATA